MRSTELMRKNNPTCSVRTGTDRIRSVPSSTFDTTCSIDGLGVTYGFCVSTGIVQNLNISTETGDESTFCFRLSFQRKTEDESIDIMVLST